MSAAPGRRLRIAVLGDFDGPHTRRWLRVFVERGHELHAISFYAPVSALDGVKLHVLNGGAAPSPASDRSGYSTATGLARRLPPNLLRLLHAWRYGRAGLRQTLRAIGPDVFHAHYVVEHGFYGSFAACHPYVVSAWGSDLFVEARRPLGRLVARRALAAADLVTANDQALAAGAVALGVAPDRVAVVRLGLGLDEASLGPAEPSINLRPAAVAPPTLISDRALEPLYNVGRVIEAFARLRQRLPAARLLIANDGSERPRLERLAGELGLGEAVRFLGRLDPASLQAALAAAHVYVSVPSSDSLALSTMEALAAGAFPVVSDLASQDGWVGDGPNGLRVAAGNVDALADALYAALSDAERRRAAVAPNRAKVAAEGDLRKNMAVMERHYYRLAGLTAPADAV